MNHSPTSEHELKQPFVPVTFEVPQRLETKLFRLRMLAIGDVEKDYEAVVSSAQRLQSMFPEWGGWPRENFTIEENLEDLRQHQQEFERREAFAYTVVSLEEHTVLGCVYIAPSKDEPFDAEVRMWVEEKAYEQGLDSILFQTVKKWLENEWPFKKVAYVGRE